MGYSSETSESATREALCGLKMFVRGSVRLLKNKLKMIEPEILLIGLMCLGVAAAISPLWCSSLMVIAALIYVLTRSEKVDDTHGDAADRQPDEPGAD